LSLTPEHIKSLLAKPERKGRTKSGPNTSVRDHKTWFALAPQSREELKDLRCENPNCLDPRPPKISALGQEIKHQHVIEVNGQKMCRYCFLGGWLLTDPNQLTIND